MPKNKVYNHIVELLEANLKRYESTSETYTNLNQAIEKFKEVDLKDSDFEDELSISNLNEVLQKFLNADKREISLKASEDGRSENARNYEELLSEFGLIKEFSLPDFTGKTIAIFGANLTGMRMRAEWLANQMKKYPDLPQPRIIFLTGDRAVFTHVAEERQVLIADIGEKAEKFAAKQINLNPDDLINSAADSVKKLVDQSIAEGKLKESDAPKLVQAITPLVIMREVNKLAPNSYALDGLETVDLTDFAKATELLKTALARRIYPNETSAAAVVAREQLGLDEEALLPANDLGKDYRATTGDNAKALLAEIAKGNLSEKVILISSQPFCQRQLKDVIIQAEDPKWQNIRGLEFEIAGSGKVDERVNPATTLDVLARDVYTSNQLWQSRAKRSQAQMIGAPSEVVNTGKIKPLSAEPLGVLETSHGIEH